MTQNGTATLARRPRPAAPPPEEDDYLGPVLARIRVFLSASGMSRSAFGVKAVGDGKFLDQLEGRTVTVRRVDRALDFVRRASPAARGS